MSNPVEEAKKELRSKLYRMRTEMHFAQRAAADQAITNTVLQLPAYREAKQVFCYVSMPHEVGTRALLKAALQDGKILGLPVCDPQTNTMQFYRLDALSELQSGAFRIPVPPVSADRLLQPDDGTLMIVPMLAFDTQGYRLGAGGGYYDRFLAAHTNIRVIGICYADYKQTQLPHNAFDQKLQYCVTEQKTEDFYG